jgi:trehalose synthase
MKASDHLREYAQYVGENYIAQIHRVARSLSGLHVLHLNTTAHGGGVAELLQPLLPLMEEPGIQHTWKVVPLDADSNKLTTHLLDMLQGGEPGEISQEEQRTFLNKLQCTPVLAHAEENRADLYCVHDFQLVPLATLFPWMRPAIWFCHVDTANPNPDAKEYVMQFLDAYNVCTFNSQESVFPELAPGQPQVITPSIDPFNEKNRYLAPAKGKEILRSCGIDTARPFISQISRFDRWKNPWQVIDVYRQVKRQIPTVQVALIGAMEAADDIRAKEVLKDLQSYAGNDPDIHLLHDPARIKDDEVNAFQRYSDVILQRSTREGFGLTATEAMWKKQPVIGTSATGLRRQIVHEQTGYIVDDTETCTAYTLKLMQHRDVWQKLGEQAHTRVKDNFLFPMMAMGYLDALVKARDALHRR